MSNQEKKRGPLSKHGGAPSRQHYVCQVEGCEAVVRGDEMKDHYKRLVDERCLEPGFKNVFGLTYQSRLNKMSKEEKAHTIHFEQHNLRLSLIPKSILTNKTHWKSLINLPLINPFQRMENKRKHTDVDNEEDDDAAPDNSKKIRNDATILLDENDNSISKTNDTDKSDHSSHDGETLPVALEAPEVVTNEIVIDIESTPDSDFKKDIKESLKDFFHDEQQCGIFAEVLVKKEKEIKEAFEDEANVDGDWWEHGLTSDLCVPCLKYSDLEEVPAGFSIQKKGNFGKIKTENVDLRSIKRNKKRHEQSELHVWCFNKAEQIETLKENQKNKNSKVSDNVVRNMLFCLKRGGSSEMFQALVDKDNLTEGVDVPTKNDSAKTFFDLRKVIFDEHSKRIKKFFKDNVKHITITLDKVTVESTSYMVILTYFFFGGEICMCLNKLEKMSEDEYDGEGTAVMIVRVLEETLGYDRFGLAQVLVHFVYDGVFANKEERVGGGGSLSLRREMCKQLGLEDGAISGDWDAAHNMQCVWKDVITEHPEVMGTAEALFKIMSNHRLGKAGTHFETRAKELGYLVVTNKKNQTTRFVRALVRGMGAALRNYPTLEIVQKEAIKDAIISKKKIKSTGRFVHEELKEDLEELKSARNLMFILGLMQILEKYCDASLAAQHSKFFPTQVWKSILKAKSEIKSLSENWIWGDQDLVYAQCGKPKEHIDRMMEEKRYIPYVSDNTIKRNQQHLKEFHGVEPHLEIGRFGVENLFEDDNEFMVELTGEVKVEDATAEAKDDIEKLLKSICHTLCLRWDVRQNQTDFQKMCSEAFADPGVEVGIDTEDISLVKTKLKNAVHCAPGENSDIYDASEILPGLLIWNQFINTHKDTPEHLAWKLWVQSLSSESLDVHATFIEFFQFVQIRSMSEAICETVGSIMNIQTGSGRHLQPVNFSAEICLRFNLGPLHVNYVVKSYDKEFVRKQISRKYSRFTEMSSSTHNYRTRMLGKCHVPVAIWK